MQMHAAVIGNRKRIQNDELNSLRLVFQLKIRPEVLRITANVSALNFTQLQPSHVYSCLQQHISKLQVNVR